MAVKKLNLSSDVKSRLRRSVLGSIDNPSATTKSAVKNSPVNIYKNRPAAKKLKKIVIKPTIEKKTKTEMKDSIKSQIADTKVVLKTAKLSKPKKIKSAIKLIALKSPTKPVLAITQKSTPDIKPFYRPLASVKRSWEVPAKEESLEKLFTQPAKPKLSNKFDSFMKTGSLTKKPMAGHFWLKIFVAIFVLVILVIAYWAVGIYKFGFTDFLTNQVAKTLNLPAGYIGNQSIGVGEFIDDYRLLAGPLAQKREGLIDYTAKTELSDRIFFRLAANKLVSEQLNKYGQAVGQQDIDNQINLLIKQSGSQAEAEKMIQNLYGLNFEQFKALILMPMMQRANLQAAIVTDESLPITATAKTRAQEVLRLAQAPNADFSALAKQYTDDEAGVNTGGDLGWVVRGQLDTNWESQIFSTATGTVISVPIRSGFGFHVVKVEQKLIDKTTGAESVKLRHVLIKVDVDQYIKELLDNSKAVKYIK